MLRYYITDRHSAGGIGPLLDYIERAMKEGVAYIQIREKDLPAGELYLLTTKVLELGSAFATRILVNSRADVALAARAHGVHLPGDSISPKILRAITPPGFLLSVSTHSVAELHTAQIEGADFAVYGSIFPPLSKSHITEPVGLQSLQQAVKDLTMPVFALGGITHENARKCIEAGAAGIAGISIFQS